MRIYKQEKSDTDSSTTKLTEKDVPALVNELKPLVEQNPQELQRILREVQKINPSLIPLIRSAIEVQNIDASKSPGIQPLSSTATNTTPAQVGNELFQGGN